MLNFPLKKKIMWIWHSTPKHGFALMILEKSLYDVDAPRRCMKFILLLLEFPDTSMCLTIPAKP